MATFPNDPLFSQQWHLYNTGQLGGIPGMDLNVVNVWDDYTGRGVVVGVFEGGGVEYTHPDLAANYNTLIDYNAVENNGNPYPPAFSGENHATATAGIIGAVAGNGIGGVGVAFDSTLASFRFSYQDSASEIRALQRLRNVDVANNSWGNSAFFYTNFQNPLLAPVGQAIKDAVQFGRDGLGTAIVWSAGNNRQDGLDTNYSNYTNSRFVTTVAAINNNGLVSSYSNPGASILVSAFGSEPNSIVTTDRIGFDGYNLSEPLTNPDLPDFNYTRGFCGTSAAAPMVSGVVALMLEANPNLGYRDIQEILAYSARQTDPWNQGWRTNGANNWNGGGLHVSHDYGFGLVDARAAVRLAETWQTQSTYANEYYMSTSRSLGRYIPDNNSVGISDTVTMGAGLQIDSVEVDLNLTHPWRGDLVVTLTSPNGTESVLVNRPGNGNDQGDNIVFTLSSTHDWGELSAGNWTLKVKDLASGDVGILNSWTLKLYGDLDTANDTYIYTNEFANYTSTSRQTLNDTSGTDTINAAAVTYNTYLNLTPGSVSTLAGKSLTIGAGTTIENAFGGDGDDIILGNSAANVLKGGRGNDYLDGSTGNDSLDGGAGNDTIYGGAGNDTLTGGSGTNTLYGGTGNDLYIISSNEACTIYEYANEGTDSVQSSWSFNLGPAYLENLTLTGTAAINGTGNTLNNAITGNSSNNILDGGDGNDTLNGGAGNDTLYGGAGNDTLNGGTGSDSMLGGTGNDTYVVDSTGDVVTENSSAGTDTVQSSISYTLGANVEKLTLTGTGAINGTGNSLNNTLTGNSANNILNGGSGNDSITGGSGNDTLVGGLGGDTLTGGTGADKFRFYSYSEGIDQISDFSVIDDTIEVSASGFGGGLIAGAAITAAQFIIGSAATTASQRFIFNSLNGSLFFDRDGIGSIAQIQIATLSTGLAMTNNDIFAIA